MFCSVMYLLMVTRSSTSQAFLSPVAEKNVRSYYGITTCARNPVFFITLSDASCPTFSQKGYRMRARSTSANSCLTRGVLPGYHPPSIPPDAASLYLIGKGACSS